MDNQEIEVRNEGSLLLWLLAVEAGGEEPLLEASGETLLNVRAQIDRPLVRLAAS